MRMQGKSKPSGCGRVHITEKILALNPRRAIRSGLIRFSNRQRTISVMFRFSTGKASVGLIHWESWNINIKMERKKKINDVIVWRKRKLSFFVRCREVDRQDLVRLLF